MVTLNPGSYKKIISSEEGWLVDYFAPVSILFTLNTLLKLKRKSSPKENNLNFANVLFSQYGVIFVSM